MVSKLAFGARPPLRGSPLLDPNISLVHGRPVTLDSFYCSPGEHFLYNFRPFPCRICDTNHSLGRPPTHLVTVKHRDSRYLAGIRLCTCCVLLKCIHFKFDIRSLSIAKNAASPRFDPIEFLLGRKKTYQISLVHFACETLGGCAAAHPPDGYREFYRYAPKPPFRCSGKYE